MLLISCLSQRDTYIVPFVRTVKTFFLFLWFFFVQEANDVILQDGQGTRLINKLCCSGSCSNNQRGSKQRQLLERLARYA